MPDSITFNFPCVRMPEDASVPALYRGANGRRSGVERTDRQPSTCRVFVQRDLVVVEDLGSTPGTCVNRRRVHSPVVVAPGTLCPFATPIQTPSHPLSPRFLASCDGAERRGSPECTSTSLSAWPRAPRSRERHRCPAWGRSFPSSRLSPPSPPGQGRAYPRSEP